MQYDELHSPGDIAKYIVKYEERELVAHVRTSPEAEWSAPTLLKYDTEEAFESAIQRIESWEGWYWLFHLDVNEREEYARMKEAAYALAELDVDDDHGEYDHAFGWR